MTQLSTRTLTLVVLAAIAMTAAAVAGIYLWQMGPQSSPAPTSRSSSPLTQELVTEIGKTADAQVRLDQAMLGFDSTPKSLDAIGLRAAEVATQLAIVRSLGESARRLEGNAEQMRALDLILVANETHTHWIEQLSGPLRNHRPTAQWADALTLGAVDTLNAWDRAQAAAAAAGERVPAVVVDLAAARRPAVVINAQIRRQRAAAIREQQLEAKARAQAERAAAADAQARPFLLRVENLLELSARARAMEDEAVTGIEQQCTISPTLGIQRLNNALRLRQSVLGQLSAMAVPAGSALTQDAFQMATQSAVEADLHRIDWMQTIDSSFMHADGTCQVPHGQYFAAAERDLASASGQFERVLARYNPAARAHGMRSNWSAATL